MRFDVRQVADEEQAATALEQDFPIVEVSQVSEQESWRKEINRPIYHIHKWWGTRLGSVFRAIAIAALSPPGTRQWDAFYKHHRLVGKVVLDPFMGSGTTLGEAIKLGAKAVGCDVNPVSTFLVRQALTPVSEATLREAFMRLETVVAPQIRRYYETRDPHSGALIPILYSFWVKIVDTPCGDAVPLFSRYVFAQDAYPKKKPGAQILCPNCWGILEGRYDATAVECVHCRHAFNPQEGPAIGQHLTTPAGRRYKIKDLLPDGKPPRHRLYAMLALRPDGEKIYLPALPEDIALYEEAEARLLTEQIPLPNYEVRTGHNTNQALGYNYRSWRDFFNARQLLCLGILLKEIMQIDDTIIQEQLLCLFSSTLEFNNLFCSYKGEGTGAVRHMFSNHILKPERTPLENSIWGTNKSSGTFSSLFQSRLIQAKRYLNEPFDIKIEGDLFGRSSKSSKVLASAPIEAFEATNWTELTQADQGVLILNGDSAHLPIPDCSVDAVITDPPYFDFVHYSELSDFFFAWLSPVLKGRYAWFNRPDSSDKGEVQHKDPGKFARQLSLVLAECCRVLKDEGILAFSFHHSRPEGWAAIYSAVMDAGFSVVAAHPVHAEQRGASPKTATRDPISLDAILVCRKRSMVRGRPCSEKALLVQTHLLSRKLKAGGLTLSNADRFVIIASQALIAASHEGLSFAEFKLHLEGLRQLLMSDVQDSLAVAS